MHGRIAPKRARRITLAAAAALLVASGLAETPGDTRQVVSTQCMAGTCTEYTMVFKYEVINGLGQWTLSYATTRRYSDPYYKKQR